MKKKAPKLTQRANLFALYREHLAAMKASLARATEMLTRGKVRFIYVPPCIVRRHRRGGYHRPYYPPLLRSRE